MNKKVLLIVAMLVIAIVSIAACAAPIEDGAQVNPGIASDSINSSALEMVDASSNVGAFVNTAVKLNSGNTSFDQATLEGSRSAVSSGDLSVDEIDGLLFMREEEKLARDVYLVLYDLWGLPVFQNIASSESTHMDSVLNLIERYGIEDPVAGNDVGEFVNQNLEALYDQLVFLGEQSLADALKVGAAIEEIDILDLQERIGQSDHADITQVYENLLKGSRNHLRAFTRTLFQETGEIYVPQYLSADVYQAIVGSGIEAGSFGGRGNGQNRSGNGRRGGK